jgi:hypothetical protein
MDLLSIFKTLLRHRWVTLPVVALTAVAGAYVFLFVPKTYEVTATYAIVDPDRPTEAEIERDPAVGRLNANNPLLRLGGPSVVVDVLGQRMSSNLVRQRLKDRGANPAYLVAPANALGVTGGIIGTTAQGPTPEEALATTRLLLEEMTRQLYEMQKVEGADDRYLMTLMTVAPGEQAVERVSGKLRSLIVVGGGGVIVLFVAISVAEAVSARRRERSTSGAPAADGAGRREAGPVRGALAAGRAPEPRGYAPDPGPDPEDPFEMPPGGGRRERVRDPEETARLGRLDPDSLSSLRRPRD